MTGCRSFGSGLKAVLEAFGQLFVIMPAVPLPPLDGADGGDGFERDRRTLAADWSAVGGDMRQVLGAAQSAMKRRRRS